MNNRWDPERWNTGYEFTDFLSWLEAQGKTFNEDENQEDNQEQKNNEKEQNNLLIKKKKGRDRYE